VNQAEAEAPFSVDILHNETMQLRNLMLISCSI
jgi:hypothetical protein